MPKNPKILSVFALSVLAGCQVSDPLGDMQAALSDALGEVTPEVTTLQTALASDFAQGATGVDFYSAVRSALLNDPDVLSAKQRVSERVAVEAATASAKDFTLDGSIYGGVKDVTDREAGLALVLDTSRLLYDGGELENQIRAARFAVEAAEYELERTKNERALGALEAWINLDRYSKLNDLVAERLEILDPIIGNLERVAASGVGDLSQVASAKRTVTSIRTKQAQVEESLELARVDFEEIYGSLLDAQKFDLPAKDLSKKLAPKNSKDIQSAPAVLAEFKLYSAAEARLASVKSRDNFSISFRSQISRPIGDSTYGSDESIGLVLTKTFFDGGKLEKDIEEAEAKVAAQLSKLRSTARRNKNLADTAFRSMKAMERALAIAEEEVSIAQLEIEFQRKQLVIGASTFETVLTAEAKAYEAEASVINIQYDLLRSVVAYAASLGHLTRLF